MKKQSLKKTVLIMALCAVLCMVLYACTKNENNANVAPEPTEDSITLTLSEAAEMANKSSSLWEMMANMFPNYVVYKASGGGYTFSAINKNLPQNKYNWKDTSEALKGIDVSAYQGTIDWVSVSANNIKFAFLRVGYRGYTSGALSLDEKFEYNAQSAVKARIPIGVYFVTTAINEAEAIEEAEWVLKQIAPYGVTWPVVLDLEESGGEDGRAYNVDAETRTKIVKAFCEKIKEAGYTPMLYSNVSWFMNKMNFEELAEYDIWFAQYFNAPHFPYNMQVWQKTDGGKVEGVKVNVDINYSMYDYGSGKHMQTPRDGSN